MSARLEVGDRIEVTGRVLVGDWWPHEHPHGPLMIEAEHPRRAEVVDLISDNYGSGICIEFESAPEWNTLRPFLDPDYIDVQRTIDGIKVVAS